MDTLAEDAAALIEALDAAPCHFVGLSMGGFIGMRLAIRRPELLKSLVLLETSADPEPPESARQYRLLNFVARWFGLGLVAGRVMPIMFGEPFLTDPERADLRAAWRERLVANDKVGITRAVKGVVEREGVYDELGEITVPTLVVVGEEDVATPPPKAERIAARIPNAELVVLPRAGHTSTVEEPKAVNAALEAFLDARHGVSE
jgi:pimeloyl-ACP methyl ester carboxylesterase